MSDTPPEPGLTLGSLDAEDTEPARRPGLPAGCGGVFLVFAGMVAGYQFVVSAAQSNDPSFGMTLPLRWVSYAACLSILLCGLVALGVDESTDSNEVWRGRARVAVFTGGGLAAGWAVAGLARCPHAVAGTCAIACIVALLLFAIGYSRRARTGQPEDGAG